MDGETFLETVRESNATALDRLGSDKALVAATDAALERARVLETAAAAEARAAATFEAWADDDPDDRARAAFAEAADRERDEDWRVPFAAYLTASRRLSALEWKLVNRTMDEG